MMKLNSDLYVLLVTNNKKGVAEYLKNVDKPISVNEARVIGDFFDPERIGPIAHLIEGKCSQKSLIQYYYRVSSGDFEFADNFDFEFHGKLKGDIKYWFCKGLNIGETAFDLALAAYNKQAALFFRSLVDEQEDVEKAKEIVSSRYSIPLPDLEKIIKRYS